ncbi:MAG: hypothetical protein CMJ48_02880, partial [Planctomycetaceae bacterium]|nr:hypothetical protein [Planctomycetaceae bacterium]
QLAESGVHLLIEKPLSTDLEGIDALLQTVRQANLTAGLAYVMRAHPALTAMRRELQSGRFGAPVQVVATCGQHFPTYRPAYREIYYTDRARGGGAIQDALTHTLNAAEWLVGPIERLAADAAHQVLSDVVVEDTVHVIARHGNVLGSYSLNQHQAPNEATTTVICEEAALRFESHLRRWRCMTTPESAWQDETFPGLERDSLFVLQVEAFLDAVEGRRPLLCPLDEGLQTLAVNLAVLQSVDEQRWTKPSDILTGLTAND